MLVLEWASILFVVLASWMAILTRSKSVGQFHDVIRNLPTGMGFPHDANQFQALVSPLCHGEENGGSSNASRGSSPNHLALGTPSLLNFICHLSVDSASVSVVQTEHLEIN
jgi:hypothetical protein